MLITGGGGVAIGDGETGPAVVGGVGAGAGAGTGDGLGAGATGFCGGTGMGVPIKGPPAVGPGGGTGSTGDPRFFSIGGKKAFESTWPPPIGGNGEGGGAAASSVL